MASPLPFHRSVLSTLRSLSSDLRLLEENGSSGNPVRKEVEGALLSTLQLVRETEVPSEHLEDFIRELEGISFNSSNLVDAKENTIRSLKTRAYAPKRRSVAV